jgi:hypothetical protein
VFPIEKTNDERGHSREHHDPCMSMRWALSVSSRASGVRLYDNVPFETGACSNDMAEGVERARSATTHDATWWKRKFQNSRFRPC